MQLINEKCESNTVKGTEKEECDGEDGKLYYEVFKGVLFSKDANDNENAKNIANAIKNQNVEDNLEN